MLRRDEWKTRDGSKAKLELPGPQGQYSPCPHVGVRVEKNISMARGATGPRPRALSPPRRREHQGLCHLGSLLTHQLGAPL